MLAKLTAKNQLTLPKAATEAVGATEYFDVQTRDGAIILTPVRIQRADALRLKLAELAIAPHDIDDAVDWSRQRVAELARPDYAPAQSAKKRAATKKSTTARGKPGTRKT